MGCGRLVDNLTILVIMSTVENMKSGSTVAKEQIARREKILDAATGVFVRYGFKKTSMDDVARAAGLSRQGLYLHFPNKVDLFRGVVAHFVDAALVERRKVLEQTDVDLETRLLDALAVT